MNSLRGEDALNAQGGSGALRTRRIASVWLPRALAERAARRERTLEAVPIAVAREERGGLRVASLTVAAHQAGARLGQTVADARAICPTLRIAPYDAEDARAFWAGLRRWSLRYSPWAAEDEADGITLDVTGCAHLFGGEGDLLEDMLLRLRRVGFSARGAIADTKGAAWALARFATAHDAVVAPVGSARSALSGLPTAALRLDAQSIAALGRIGVRTIGDLAATPRAASTRRFGASTLRRLDQAFGVVPEPLSPAPPETTYAARLSFAEPIGRVEDVMAAIDAMLERLSHSLERNAVGARTLRLTARRVDREETSIEVGLARPSRDPKRIAPLFQTGVERLEAGFGVEALRLKALTVEPLEATQTSATAHLGPDPRDPRSPAAGAARDPEQLLADLIGRLGARLGVDAVRRLTPTESHAPERAASISAAAFSTASATWPSHAAARPPRPLTGVAPLLIGPGDETPPEEFFWRGRSHRVAAALGPERITPEWWLDDPAWRDGLRDYWRIETEDGLRAWIFHTPQAGLRAAWRFAGLFA